MRDVDVDPEAAQAQSYSHDFFLQLNPEPVALPPIDDRPRRTSRRSFLTHPFSRQQSSQRSTLLRHTRRSPSQLLNPINHVPRPTPSASSLRSPTLGTFPAAGAALLSTANRRLPDNEPSLPQGGITSEQTRQGRGNRVRGDRRFNIRQPQRQGTHFGSEPVAGPSTAMSQAEKQGHDDHSSEDLPKEIKTVPPSRYNTQDRDVEAGLPASQSMLGQTYGIGADDLPNQPPRQRKSHGSLHEPQSGISHTQERKASGQIGGARDAEMIKEELAWGPQHPCYPHLNPHVPMHSDEYANTRIIRVKRDWMVRGDLAPTFSNLYPEILDPLLPEHQFRRIIEHVNRSLVISFDPFRKRNWLDVTFGFLTGWLWDDLGWGGVKKQLSDVERWLTTWNHEYGEAEGVKVIPLRRTAYMSVDIQIPDPQIRIVSDGELGPADTPTRSEKRGSVAEMAA